MTTVTDQQLKERIRQMSPDARNKLKTRLRNEQQAMAQAQGREMRSMERDVPNYMEFTDQGDVPAEATTAPGLAQFMTGSPTESFRETAKDLVPAVGSLMVPPQLKLPAQALTSGVGTGAGELLRQGAFEGEIDVGRATGMGALEGGFTFGLGKLFRFTNADNVSASELDDARRYARENDLPRPLGMFSKMSKNLGQLTTLGQLSYQKQIGKFADIINKQIDSIAERVDADELAIFSDNALSTIQKTFDARQGFDEVKEIIGENFLIDLTPFYSQIDDLIIDAKAQGFPDVVSKLADMKEAYIANPDRTVLKTFSDMDTQMFNLMQGSFGRTKAGELVNDAFKNSIETTLQKNPQKIERMGMDPEKFITKLDEAFSVNKAVKKAIKNNQALRALVKQNPSPSRFITQWSMSPEARKVIKDIDPELHDTLNQHWLGRNLAGKVMNKEGTAVKDPTAFIDFVKQQKETMTDMFGEDGYQAIKDFGNYVRYTADYTPRKDISEGAALAQLAGRGIGTSGLAYFLGPGTAFGSEAGGYLLVKAIMEKGGLQQIFNPKLTQPIKSAIGATKQTLGRFPQLMAGPGTAMSADELFGEMNRQEIEPYLRPRLNLNAE
tara:strand:+ start:385 stop:2214 length:1830 start_codon:yes stop_codon:yes gene_type:complete